MEKWRNFDVRMTFPRTDSFVALMQSRSDTFYIVIISCLLFAFFEVVRTELELKILKIQSHKRLETGRRIIVPR
jgi:hypothetical protein